MIVKESFENNTINPDFTRSMFNTVAEMKAVPKKTMPYVYIATCKETGKAYIYNKNNEIDETLGLWRELGAGNTSGGSGSDSGSGSGSDSGSGNGISVDEVKNLIKAAMAHTMYQFDTLPNENIDGIEFKIGDRAYQGSDKKIYVVEDEYDGSISWALEGETSGGGSSGGGGSNPSEPSEPSEPSTEYTLYYGYINGSLSTTEKVTDEGFTINADVLKALSSKTITSKSNSITYTATDTEENALGQSFPTYAYPASLGEITKYTNSVGTFNVADSYTRFDVDVDGTAYYAYVQTKGHAPMAGDTFDFTYA